MFGGGTEDSGMFSSVSLVMGNSADCSVLQLAHSSWFTL